MAEIEYFASLNWISVVKVGRGHIVTCLCGYSGPTYGNVGDLNVNVSIHRKLCPRKVKSVVDFNRAIVHLGVWIAHDAMHLNPVHYGFTSCQVVPLVDRTG